METYKTTAHINSLKGDIDEITVMKKLNDQNEYLVDYRGVKCIAIFNWFVCEFYADDLYRRIDNE